MTPRARFREVDVAAPVVAHFRALGYDVHQEVRQYWGGARADIVAVCGTAPDAPLHVVEVKSGMTRRLVAQALGWLPHARFVSVAIPAPLRHLAPKNAPDPLERAGVGLFHVDGIQVVETRAPVPMASSRFSPQLEARLRSFLCHDTREGGEAGNAANRYHTPFRGTCAEVRRVLAHGPLTTREIVERIAHHYRTDRAARGALSTYLSEGKVQGVRRRGDDGLAPGTVARWELAP